MADTTIDCETGAYGVRSCAMELAQSPPQRIVSLCPSVTETLFALGVGAHVVGRTRYCIHPGERVSGISDVGGTKTVDLARVDRLQPDLIVAVREENAKAQVEELARRHAVLVLDPVDIETALDDITRLGARVGALAAARRLRAEIGAAFEDLPQAGGVPVVYLIWRKPWMAVGASTYIHVLLARLGLVNVAALLGGRYPTLDQPTLQRLAPRLVLASTEPFPFREKHLAELGAIVPGACPVLVDGEMFSWHGARMKLAAAYFTRLIPQLATLATASR